jgi:hypothetical protein
MSDEQNYRDDIYSKAVRAGKRTYFFDVRTTRGNDLYLTITESKRRYTDDGKFHYEKHKLFLYKEDFEKFDNGLEEAIEKIKELQSSGEYSSESPMDRVGTEGESTTPAPVEEETPAEEEPAAEEKKDASDEQEFTDVSFEDLED